MEIRKLQNDEYYLAYEHLCALSDEDKRLRFNATVTNTQIFNYCQSLNKNNHFVFGLFEHDVFIGFLHIAPDIQYKEGWEIGLSVSREYQGRNYGTALMNFAKEEGERQNWRALTFRYSESNRKLFALCNKSGFTTAREGSEYLSYYEVIPALSISDTIPIVFD